MGDQSERELVAFLGSFLDPLSLEKLQICEELVHARMKTAKAAQRVEARDRKVTDYVEMLESFIPTGDFLFSGIRAEIESLGLSSKSSSSPSNKWLSLVDEDYTWFNSKGTKFAHKANDLSQYPSILNLMEKINTDLSIDINSCLVTHYKDGKAGIRLHQDDEKELDPNSPICVFTVGAIRPVDFLSIHKNYQQTPCLTLKPTEGSLYLMKPGCQKCYKHRVLAQKSAGPRFSLSFRRRLPVPELQPSPIKSQLVKSRGNVTSTPMQFVTSSQAGSKPYCPLRTSSAPRVLSDNPTTTVLFGTSITSGIKSSDVTSGSRNFVNCSTSGARIQDVEEMMLNFSETDQLAGEVEKVIISVGTNDVKHHRRRHGGMWNFRQPLIELVKKARALFPGAAVVIQSLLPMKNIYWYTVGNVLGFNDVIRDICSSYNCYFLDLCSRFIDANRGDINPQLFNDWIHLNKWGRNILTKWFGFIVSGKVKEELVWN